MVLSSEGSHFLKPHKIFRVHQPNYLFCLFLILHFFPVHFLPFQFVRGRIPLIIFLLIWDFDNSTATPLIILIMFNPICIKTNKTHMHSCKENPMINTKQKIQVIVYGHKVLKSSYFFLFPSRNPN